MRRFVCYSSSCLVIDYRHGHCHPILPCIQSSFFTTIALQFSFYDVTTNQPSSQEFRVQGSTKTSSQVLNNTLPTFRLGEINVIPSSSSKQAFASPFFLFSIAFLKRRLYHTRKRKKHGRIGRHMAYRSSLHFVSQVDSMLFLGADHWSLLSITLVDPTPFV